MRKDFTIGLVVPFATDAVPDEGLQMYPGVRFVARGVGVRSLTPAGYDGAWAGILPAAQHPAGLQAGAIMVIGTSLTFYRGAEADDQLMAKLRATPGLPLRTFGVAKRLEQRHGIPVVASTQAAFWAALRLVGESGGVAGRGRLLEQSTAAPVH